MQSSGVCGEVFELGCRRQRPQAWSQSDFGFGFDVLLLLLFKRMFLNVDSSLSKPNEDRRSTFSKLAPFAYIEKESTSILCDSLLLPDAFQRKGCKNETKIQTAYPET